MYARTGGPHVQTVVSNQYGYFATYVYEADQSLQHARWSLVRSTNGGATLPPVYQHCPPPALLSTCPGGPAPAIETDRDGNIYLIYSDVNTGHAYFMRFLVANNYQNPTSVLLEYGEAQKYSAVIDESRGKIYYAANSSVAAYPTYTPTTMWLYTISLDGSDVRRDRLTVPGVTFDVPSLPDWGPYPVEAQYPSLYLDEHEHLYVAWTTSFNRSDCDPEDQTCVAWNYYSIHFMRSLDGAGTWQTLAGTPLTLPVVAGGDGAEVDEVTVEQNMGSFLWNILVKQGKVHFIYREGTKDGKPLHYVRYDTVTSVREQDTTTWGGEEITFNSPHGDCSTRRERLDSTIYCVSTTAGPDDRLAVLVTEDNGQTWKDHAATLANTGCNETCHHFLSTARQVAEGSVILGAYTQGQNGEPAPLSFFTVPVPGPSLLRFPNGSTTATAISEPPGILAEFVDDNNMATFWAAAQTNTPANNNAWIQLDLGAVKEVRHVKWTTATPHAPAHYTISASSDGVSWKVVNTRAFNYAVIDGYEPVYLNARFLRLTTTKVGTDADNVDLALGFWEFWAEGSEPPTPATPRIPINWVDMSSQAAGYGGSFAVDGNFTTTWAASTTSHPSNNNVWVQMDLGSSQPITRLRWLGAEWNPAGVHSPANYKVRVSNDFSHWKEIVCRENAVGIVNGEELLAVTARYIELLVTKVHDGTGWGMGFREFWVEGPPDPPNP